MLTYSQFGIIQNIQRSLISQTSFLIGTIFATSYSGSSVVSLNFFERLLDFFSAPCHLRQMSGKIHIVPTFWQENQFSVFQNVLPDLHKNPDELLNQSHLYLSLNLSSEFKTQAMPPDIPAAKLRPVEPKIKTRPSLKNKSYNLMPIWGQYQVSV